ncbi:MAG TPA: hypothetical protein VFT74_18035, partial [Isosphaeraceae bacterium]|nr:hypothetical protein [Isosphaeraceae bacterium]
MRSLLLRLDLHRETPEQSQTLARLVSFLLGTDPSSSLVTMTLESLHDRLDLLDASRSLTARSIDSGLWALDTLLEALVEPNLDPQRAETLAGEIDSVLGAGATQSLLASSAKQATVEVHHVRSKFVRSLYEKLTKETVRDASQASVPEAEAALFTRAAGVLPDGERTGLRADLLATALDASGGAWDRYLDAVRQVLDQGTAKDVENILNVYLNTQNTVLQQALELEIRNRLDDSSALVSPSEVAEAFRLKGRSGGSRRAVFEERATASLARAKASKGPTET